MIRGKKTMVKASSRKRMTEDKLREIIVKHLPKLLEKEPVLRDYLANLIKEKFADKRETEESIREILLIIKEQNKRLEEHSKRLEEHSKRLEEHSKRLEELSKRLEEHSKILEELMKEIKGLKRNYDKTLSALGARWGLLSEKAFREGMKAILEGDFGVRVERYWARDEEGKVFGKPDQVEIDLIIKDGKVVGVEIKSSASKADLYVFWKKIKFFEEKEGRKVDRLIFISPMVEPKAYEFARDLGIEIYPWPEDVNLENDVL